MLANGGNLLNLVYGYELAILAFSFFVALTFSALLLMPGDVDEHKKRFNRYLVGITQVHRPVKQFNM